MRFRATTVLLILSVIAVLWGVGSWSIAKISKKQFDAAVSALSRAPINDFFELEVLNYQDTLLGASAEILLIPTSALVETSLKSQRFFLKCINGPVFINASGVQLGLARWKLTSSDNTRIVGSWVVNFFESINIQLDVSKLLGLGDTVGRLKINGQSNTAHLDTKIVVQVSELNYTTEQFAVNLPTLEVVLRRTMQESPDHNRLLSMTQLSAEAKGGALLVTGRSKKIPFNLQSHGSIWINNDTLSSDWQGSIDSGQRLTVSQKEGAALPGYLNVEMSLQLRELLAAGFWQYVSSQSEIYSLLQQAQWAMEETETPEQQDFLRSLFLGAERIRGAQLTNPLKPMLIANRSKIAVGIRVNDGRDGLSSQLLLNGNAIDRSTGPVLSLKGDAKISREMLSERWVNLLDKWSNRRLFRRYETEFESDIVVRNERLLLNDMIVSVDNLGAELSQALADQ